MEKKSFLFSIFDIFNRSILPQNKHRGYTLEQPRRLRSKIRKKCIPQFHFIKVGGNGVFISRTSFPDD